MAYAVFSCQDSEGLLYPESDILKVEDRIRKLVELGETPSDSMGFCVERVHQHSSNSIGQSIGHMSKPSKHQAGRLTAPMQVGKGNLVFAVQQWNVLQCILLDTSPHCPSTNKYLI